MKRANGVLASLRVLNSLVLTRTLPTRHLHLQVTHYSQLPPLFSSSHQKSLLYNQGFITTLQKLYFSSKPNSIVELVTTNEWSEDLEHELSKSLPSLTHETVLYVLKKLDKTPQKALSFFNWVSDERGFKSSFTVYTMMLKILADKETMKDFWVLSKKMSDEGWDVDEETYLTILSKLKGLKMVSAAQFWTECFTEMTKASKIDGTVKSVVDVVLGSDWNDDVKKKLGKLNLKLSENIMLRIFRALRRAPLKAYEFFFWVEEHMGYTHNAVTYNSILRVLAREESIDKFWSVVEKLKSAGHDIDIDTYIKLSRHFQGSRMMKDAVELYILMMDSPYKPSVGDCSTLLKHISLTPTPDLNLVFRVVKKYEGTGHTLSKAVYDGIHRSLTSVGRFDEAEKIMETMRNAGYEPDNITYSQVVFGLCKVGRFEDACKMLDEMESQGCAPDLKTWTMLIQGHCAAGKIDGALTCFTKMLGKNREADADLLEVLVNGMCNNRRVDGAYTLVKEMVDNANLRPWQATYKNLIEKLLEARKLEEALDLLHLMKKHNFPPYPEPFDKYISKFGTVDDATQFLKMLSIKQYPSSSAHLQLFQAFLKEGRQSEARDLLYRCPHHIRNHPDILKLFA